MINRRDEGQVMLKDIDEFCVYLLHSSLNGAHQIQSVFWSPDFQIGPMLVGLL